MLMYSAMKNIENFIAEYSVWYPATSSLSDSGRSNGARLVSAKAATRKTQIPRVGKHRLEKLQRNDFHAVVHDLVLHGDAVGGTGGGALSTDLAEVLYSDVNGLVRD